MEGNYESLLAQAGHSIQNPILGKPLQNLLNISPLAFFQKFIPNAIGLAFIIGVIIFFFVLIIGAIQWIASGGDKASVETARTKITNAIIGIVVLFVIYALIKVIEIFFGINILELNIGALRIT